MSNKELFKEIKRHRRLNSINRDLEKTLVDELKKSIDKKIINELFKLSVSKSSE